MRRFYPVFLLTLLPGALHAQSPTVASVFRAGANGLGLNPYGATSVSYSGGGSFVGTPAAASNGAGKVFAVALADVERQ